ncbi:MAG: cation:proton antiporter [Chitinophagaceae bacterium]|nr:cation:proton antiporter [Chitinophagaceae bacterium]MCA6453439.1 cation:proton antiporter [Chitinophagaceae bacterium]MCA6455240.1 cation:proton antiporter [Chitinophagaceae bacterium]MCA6460040.1 cation:proton antiporter [Chitinophagaceae bacterium]MCA6465393.1 cation:proton antiporter [Chitinophagaceae bacterium]
MTNAIIITLCILLLIAYVFDLTASKTRIPSVILLLLLGFVVRELADILQVSLPDLTPVLPVLGTIGLILIVLEGSLELEFNASKTPLIKRSVTVALLPMLALAFGLAWVLQQVGGYSFKDSLTNAIPLCVISSAIAIPSVKSLGQHSKEFVIYESSLSDILGVLLFNFVALNEFITLYTVGGFVMQLLVITAVSFVATIGLSLLLSRIDHHIKFAPIILLVILIYAVSKIYHLPGLIFILLFGLFLGNLDELQHVKWIHRLNPVALNKEVHKFREITTEAAFLIRALFFLLFGYLIETAELLNTETLVWAAGIVAAIFLLRAIQLRLSGLPLKPLLFIAPRGLITILLFLSITPDSSIPLVNRSLIIQVIILSALVMMFGLMTTQTKERQPPVR